MTELQRAFYSVREFCERNAISRATFYRRVPQDQLMKVGRKTLVPIACEQAWHAKLQKSLPTPIPTLKRRQPETA